MVAICCIVQCKRNPSPSVTFPRSWYVYETLDNASDSRHWLQALIDLSCWMSPAMIAVSARFAAHALHVVYIYRSLTISNPTVGFVCMTLWSPGIVRRGSAWVILTLPIAVVYIGVLGIKCRIIDANHILSPSVTHDIPASFVILHCPFRWLFHLVDKKWVFFLVFFSSEYGSWKGSFLV
jgi:hypothetical protein